jgi:hypothetical protein
VVQRHPVLFRHKDELTSEVDVQNIRIARLRVVHYVPKGQLQLALGRIQKLKIVDVRKLTFLVVFEHFKIEESIIVLHIQKVEVRNLVARLEVRRTGWHENRLTKVDKDFSPFCHIKDLY